jgi:hypothetical protein
MISLLKELRSDGNRALLAIGKVASEYDALLLKLLKDEGIKGQWTHG